MAAYAPIRPTVSLPPCGCEVDGYGTLPQPAVIRFCPLHAQAPAMLDVVRRALDYVEHCAEWGANKGQARKHEITLRARALLRALDGHPEPAVPA